MAQAAASALGAERAFTSALQLAEDPSIDVLHICTPNHLHVALAEAALAARKHVICEKPLALDVPSAATLAASAEAAGLQAGVPFVYRYYPTVREARSLVGSGQTGPLRLLHGSYLQDWLLRESDWNWRLEPELGGEMRAVADIGSHWLDLIGFIAGQRVTRVFADFTTILPVRRKPTRPVETFSGKELAPDEYEERPIRTEDFATVLLRFADGAPGAMTVSQVSAGHKNRLVFEINGADASLAWNSERPEELWIGRRERPSELLQRDPALLAPEARATTSYPGGHAEGFPDTFKALYGAVYRAVAAGAPPVAPDYPTFADGVRALRLGDAIATSARDQRWVDVVEGDA